MTDAKRREIRNVVLVFGLILAVVIIFIVLHNADAIDEFFGTPVKSYRDG